MIVPMKKVSLIIPDSKRKDTLKTLRKAGILHIEISEGSGERLNALKNQQELLEKALFLTKRSKIQSENALPVSEATEKALEIIGLEEDKKLYQAEKIKLLADIEKMKGWGDTAPSETSLLKNKGLDVTLYEMPLKEYEKLSDDIKTVPVSKSKNTVKFLTVTKATETSATEEKLKSFIFTPPALTVAEMQGKVRELDENISRADEKISSLGCFSDSIKNAVKTLGKEIEFETYATGMAKEMLTESTEKEVSVAVFSGFIEQENLEALKKTANENAWGLISDDPTEDDNAPTKLKNNKFVSLIYPLTDFLGTVPGYFEYDISGWFLGFILIFFGIIFGDGGYGLLICAAAAIPITKALIQKKKVSPAFLLVGLLGLSTVLWGTLTCTWFGLSPDRLPQWIKILSVPFISNVYGDTIWYPFWSDGTAGLTTAQNLQIFCFTLALIQLTVAHIKGAVRHRKSIKILGDIGSALQLSGIYYLVLSLVVNAEVFSFSLVIGGIPVGALSLALIAVGFVLSFVFSNYEGSIIKSVLASLKNIVSVLLGVVNVFSDIVSYIRLWAVGLAGAAISATVNELAGPLFGKFAFMIVAVFILVFGHGLNMILNVLSVIVHGIRLNTLEFSSHLDMSWSGHKFKPFEE